MEPKVYLGMMKNLQLDLNLNTFYVDLLSDCLNEYEFNTARQFSDIVMLRYFAIIVQISEKYFPIIVQILVDI